MTMTPSGQMTSNESTQVRELSLAWMLNNEDWQMDKISTDEFERQRRFILERSHLFFNAESFVLEWMEGNKIDLPPRTLSVMERARKYNLHFVDKANDALKLLGAERITNHDGILITSLPIAVIKERVEFLMDNGVPMAQAELTRHLAFVVNSNHPFVGGPVRPPMQYLYPATIRDVVDQWNHYTHSSLL